MKTFIVCTHDQIILGQLNQGARRVKRAEHLGFMWEN